MRTTHEDDYDNQPLSDPSVDVTLVADLRLDNREQLASALGFDDARLVNLPDSALLLAAYRHWGPDCAEHLVGDFAFAVWDARARKLVLGRDHMGARGFYYFRGKDFFAFATARKGLIALPEVPSRLDEFPRGADPSADIDPLEIMTGFHGIYGLVAGSVMTVEAGGAIGRRQYWTPRADPTHVGRDDVYYVETYRRLLTEAVQCRIRRARRAPGLFMSGGFDSSAIAALAGPVLEAKQRKLIAAASVMPEDYSGEIPHARRWVEYCRRDMAHLDVRYVTTEGEDLLAGLEQDFLALDGSLGAAAIAAKAMCRSIADRGAGILLDGNGGDYTVNVTARGFVFELLRRGRLLSAMRELAGFRRTRNLTWPQAINREAVSHILATLRERFRPRGEFRSHPPFTQRYRAALRDGAGGFAPRVREAARSGWGQRLASVQSMQRQTEPRLRGIATQYGLDFAQPFLDKRVIEFALAVPLSLVARDGLDRFLARKAFGGLYPREFAARVRKGRDSDVPDIVALARQARPQFIDGIARMERSERLRKLYDFGRIRKLLEAPSSEQEARRGVTTFMAARFVEWFERDNRFERENETDKKSVSVEP